MNTGERPKSHTAAWTLVLLAVPVLYVLSVPWVYAWLLRPPYFHASDPPGSSSLTIQGFNFAVDPFHGGPEWFIRYARPYSWLYETPLKDPLTRYWDWCVKVYQSP